ncbi:hypothetical protein EVAR_76022_1 [Eumeta japonica]|uniref:Uncharacterized protein n=1 Tax=Eumeta variegata TaxID=151549 RepID=A0A4C1UB35_EUMVA|nr:hypothetical protein EVAR_76022_1 [Eumeta japonica]
MRSQENDNNAYGIGIRAQAGDKEGGLLSRMQKATKAMFPNYVKGSRPAAALQHRDYPRDGRGRVRADAADYLRLCGLGPLFQLLIRQTPRSPVTAYLLQNKTLGEATKELEVYLGIVMILSAPQYRQINISVGKLKTELTDHPPYDPDSAPNDFYLFPSVKNKLRGQRCWSREEAVDAFKMHVLEIPQSECTKSYKN